MQNNFYLYVYNHTDVINIYIRYHPQCSIKTRSTAVISLSFLSKIETTNEHCNTPLSFLFFYTCTHRFMQNLVNYDNGNWMR